MLSECGRATTAAESRFRVDTANSVPRTVSVVALDPPSERIVADLAEQSWGRARFRRAPDLTADPAALVDEVAGADLVVMIARVGTGVPTATALGEMCRLSRVATMTLVVTASGDAPEETARTLARLRPHSDMLVVTSSADCFGDLLRALRA